MTQATDQDIRELKTAIADLTASVSGLREEMRVGFSNVETRFADVRGDIKLLDNRLGNLESTAQKLPDLAEKVGELKNWKQIAIVIFTASASGAIAWFLRSGKL
jgi:16S rRNA C1402 N4-methylase RsmH